MLAGYLQLHCLLLSFLEKCFMATLPVYMKYQFKLYPFLSLYLNILLPPQGFDPDGPEKNLDFWEHRS